MRRFPLWLHVVVFSLSISVTAFAQRERDTWSASSPNQLEVAGQVRLAQTGGPGAKIPVTLERFGGGIVDTMDTDGTGRFRFPSLTRGYYKVVIKAPGYRVAQQDADLQVLFRAFLVFELVPDNSTTSSTGVSDVIDANASPEAREQLSRGRDALAKKSHSEAITHLEKAIGLYPQYYQAHIWLGTTYVDTREWAKAEQSFQKALEIKPESTVAIIALGEVYWRQKRFEDSEKALLDGLKVDDKNWHGYFTLSRLYWEQGNIAKAAPAVGRALQLRPDFAEAHLLAGNILLKVNQHERALVEYKEYLKLEPKGEFAVATQELVDKLSKAVLENKKSLN